MLSPVLKFATNKAGFKILAASIAPSPPPAPTSVCESNKGSTMSPSDEVTSFTTAF
jgi:hypothetical protein